MAGSLSIALTQQFDINGQPLAGALLYFFQVGTVATPQDSYQDFGLTILNPNPLVADQSGRIPNFYLADGQVHARLTDSTGVVIFDQASLQVVGPSSGSGGGGSVDPTTIAATGDVKFRATSESLTGWVKCNAQTIGNASSGASQRANSDTQSLFVYLWSNFTNAHCPVSGGRGSTALSDFSTNKTIQLPDWRARVLSGLDDMGNSAAGIILASNVTSSGDGPTTPAATGGESNHTLALAEAPNGQITFNDPGHAHPPLTGSYFMTTSGGSGNGLAGGATGSLVYFDTTGTGTVLTGASLSDHAGGGAHNNMQPFVLGTFFMKL